MVSLLRPGRRRPLWRASAVRLDGQSLPKITLHWRTLEEIDKEAKSLPTGEAMGNITETSPAASALAPPTPLTPPLFFRVYARETVRLRLSSLKTTTSVR